MNLAKWREGVLQTYPEVRAHLEWVEQRMNRCESDLERLFLILFAVSTHDAKNISYAGEPPLQKAQVGRRYLVDFDQQVQLAGYRCDFTLTIKLVDGSRSRCVAIECDGHSFHDRTREQASSDRRRDRRLIAEGVSTLRYTYSDLTRDPTGSMADLNQTMRSIASQLFDDGPSK